MLSTQKSLTDLIADAKITLKAERTDSNPNMPESRDMDHWKVKLTRSEASSVKCTQRTFPGCGCRGRHAKGKAVANMTLVFSMGYGHNGAEPDVAGVLDCLLSDSDALDRDFEEWASDLGYDPDSRTAERTYKACLKSGEKLKVFLGDGLFDRMRTAER